MTRRKITFAAAALVVMAISPALAQQKPQRTFVSLSGSADDHPRLGNPAIHVEVRSVSAELAESLARRLTADLDANVYARPDRGEAPYDYRLEIALLPPAIRSNDDPLRFEALLVDPDGEVIWRTEGRTEIAGRVVNDEAVRGVSRNLVSALVHDRWVVRKIDPDDPPPMAPRVKPPE